MQVPITIRSVSTVHFIGAIVQNAGEPANLPIPANLSTGGDGRMTLQTITVLSMENLAWELWFFGRNTFESGAGAVIDTQIFLGSWTFTTVMGLRRASTGFYHYDINDLQMPYADLDNLGQLHTILINRSAAAKTAGAPGAVVVQVGGVVTLSG